tara:strand:- start:183 stop:416 length:234 start_codon:yes stop_codon:yes gene_type:complete
MKKQNKKFLNKIERNIKNENKRNAVDDFLNVAVLNSIDSKKDIFVIVLIILSLGGIGLYDYLRRKRNKKEINKIEKS